MEAANRLADRHFNPLPPYGGRPTDFRKNFEINHFNPLPPYGGRHHTRCLFPHTVPEFQSTPSVWRETLREQTATGGTADFNPLPPYGGRPRYSLVTGRYSSFQSTPSVWRETSFSDFNNFRFFISIHSLRMEGDHH